MKVLVCDDHPIVASAIAMMIETAFDATICICHTYAAAAVIAAEHGDIALCLLDIHIPGEDAGVGVKALQAALPAARFVLFSGSSDEADLMLALDLEMHGFLPKSSPPQVVEAALRLVMAGGVYLPAGIGELAMRNTGRNSGRNSGRNPGHNAGRSLAAADVVQEQPAAPPQAPAEHSHTTLSERQIMVLEHVATGRSNKEIARELEISPATVKAHVAQIIAVLGVSNRIEAAARARGLGLIDQQ